MLAGDETISVFCFVSLFVELALAFRPLSCLGFDDDDVSSCLVLVLMVFGCGLSMKLIVFDLARRRE